MLDILLGLGLAASPSAGTALDIHSFQVVKQSSGPVDYYAVETGPRGDVPVSAIVVSQQVVFEHRPLS